MARVEIKIDIDAVFAPARYVLYLIDNISGSAVLNRHLKLGDKEDKQLAVIMSVLCNHRRRRITPTRVLLKRPCILQATIEDKKKKDSYAKFCVFFDRLLNIFLSNAFAFAHPNEFVHASEQKIRVKFKSF